MTTDRGGIVVYSLDTRKYERLTDFGFTPVWLRDSQRLIFSSEEGVFAVDSRSKAVTQVLKTSPDLISVGGFSPDDRQIYLMRTVQEADVWLATLK